MNFHKIIVNTLAVIIGVPMVLCGGLFVGMTLPLVLIGGGLRNAFIKEEHSALTWLQRGQIGHAKGEPIERAAVQVQLKEFTDCSNGEGFREGRCRTIRALE